MIRTLNYCHPSCRYEPDRNFDTLLGGTGDLLLVHEVEKQVPRAAKPTMRCRKQLGRRREG